MMTRSVVTEEGKNVSRHYPAVHNLLFLKADRSTDELRQVLTECPFPISVYCQIDKPGVWCQISDSDMTDIRLMCDTTFSEPKFITQEESELKVGTEVIVTHGPFKGITGKLIRKNKKYYLVKSIAGLGVMVSVSRWCCQEVKKNEDRGLMIDE